MGWLDCLKNGSNYRVQQGNRDDTKIVICESFGYTCNQKRINKDGSVTYYLRCKYYPTCKVTGTVKNGLANFPSMSICGHTCQGEEVTGDGPSDLFWEAKECMTRMKHRAGSETSSFEAIFCEEVEKAGADVAKYLDKERCRKMMQTYRLRKIPVCPKDIAEVVSNLDQNLYPKEIQDCYWGAVHWDEKKQKQTKRHFALLLGDQSLFSSVAAESTFFFGDGTFRVTPRQARILSFRGSQVWNLVADYHGKAVCVLSVVMTSRKTPLYEAVLRLVRQLFPDFVPPKLMLDFEPAIRKAVATVYPETQMIGCRFHYCQALFKKLKNKFRLASFFRSTGNGSQVNISFRLRQYMSLNLLKPEDMRPELERLECELKSVSKNATNIVRKRLQDFHHYFVKYWMSLIGFQTISVFGAEHKTGNIIERFNHKLSSDLPEHPTLFRFMIGLKTQVMTPGLAIVSQGTEGVLARGRKDRLQKSLLEKAKQLEDDYGLGKISAAALLRKTALHYDNDRFVKTINAEIPNEVVIVKDPFEDDQEEQDGEASDGDDSKLILDVIPCVEDQSVDDRALALEEDEHLSDVSPEVWITTDWSDTEHDLSRESSTEECRVNVCYKCGDFVPEQVVLNNCTHTLCQGCFNKVKVCPVCMTPKGKGRGHKVNVSFLRQKRQADILQDDDVIAGPPIVHDQPTNSTPNTQSEEGDVTYNSSTVMFSLDIIDEILFDPHDFKI